ncbi:MAG: DNA internalization-related competence protein ComEC/Rec2 [Firmicutes bacterium]|nr:DNA internalization-related competence protein ComEC/Rec2 [Bacillota bacterium]
MRRKLFVYTLAFMAGLVLCDALGKTVLFLVVAYLLYCIGHRTDGRQYLIFFLAGMLLFLMFQFQFNHGVYHDTKGERAVTGVVLDTEQKEEETCRFTVDAGGERILLTCYRNMENPWILIGETITFWGEVMLPPEPGNPRTFDYRRYLLTRGIEYVCVTDDISVRQGRTSLYYRIKKGIIEKREAYLQALSVDKEAEGVLRGILFGDKSRMDEDTYDAFRKNGTAHVLAVSGLHVGMLYGIYRWLYTRWKKRILTAAFLAFLFLYGTAALWAVSVTRAVGLIVLVVLGRTADRRYDLLTALSAMALFSMVKNPYVVFGAGFQMSFLAVLSIVFLQRPFAKIIGEKWAVPLAVQAGLLPYMAYTFNYVSFTGILCNVPVIFLTSLLVPTGIAGFMVYLCFGRLLPGLSQMLEAVTSLMVWCNGLFEAEGMLSFDVISPPLWIVIIIYGMLFFCASEYFHIYYHRKAWQKMLGPVLLIIVCIFAGAWADWTSFDKAELVFVDVGQGDCLHLKTSEERHILIDGGGKYGYNTGEKTLKPYLLKNRITEIDLAAATHLHLDHYAGLAELAACYPVKRMLTEGKAGQQVILEDRYRLEILWPREQNPDTDDENENSLIFMVHHNGLKTLVTGDITEEGEEMLLKAYRDTDKLQADILKIAHHGSPYSTSDAFLNAVQPKVAVISVGRNNYGHPSEIVIEKLEQKGIMVFRTDLDGAVGIINRKGIISVCTEKQR